MTCSAVIAASPDAAAARLDGSLIEFLFSGSAQSAAPQHQTFAPDSDARRYAADPRYVRQVVDYNGGEKPGTVIINTRERMLYLVEPGGKALRYGIGVGREGFTWSGTETVSRKAEWPDWTPPPEMLRRQPYLPRFMAGGPQNPLGARAMYLGGTIYRIHGTNQPSTIGGQVSSGCIRMVNDDVIDLYGRVNVGAKVVVLPAERGADAYARARSGSTVSVTANRTSVPSLD
jgi:lipoprotein-anchoring transpeptidase ErfK/SrfK